MAGDITRKKKILFICTQTLLKSPTAEKFFSKDPCIDARSAGLNKEAAVLLNTELLEWADIVFVMEKKQRDIIQKRFKDIYKRKRIVCLGIPDEYDFMSSESYLLYEIT